MGKTYEIYASLFEDVNSGWIWTPEECVVSGRGVVKISCNEKTVYCEAIPMDKNFIKRYNKDAKCKKLHSNERMV